MIAGSFASAAHGLPRTTQDLDVVIDPPDADALESLVQSMAPEDYYVDGDAARDALRRRGMFNVIDQASGWKVAGILVTVGEDLDRSYVERWVLELDLAERQSAGLDIEPWGQRFIGFDGRRRLQPYEAIGVGRSEDVVHDEATVGHLRNHRQERRLVASCRQVRRCALSNRRDPQSFGLEIDRAAKLGVPDEAAVARDHIDAATTFDVGMAKDEATDDAEHHACIGAPTW